MPGDELEQRVHGALRARTYGELAELLADLPGDGRMPSPRTRLRTNQVARTAVFGAGLLVAVTAAVAVVVVVAMLVLAAAALWVCLVVCWLVCRGMSARHAHRVRQPAPSS